jgi:hypothetical protein
MDAQGRQLWLIQVGEELAMRAGREGEETVPESLLHGLHTDLLAVGCGHLSRDQYPRVPGHGGDSGSHLWRTDSSPVPDPVSKVSTALTRCGGLRNSSQDPCEDNSHRPQQVSCHLQTCLLP